MYYGYGYYPFFDPTMILVLIGVILSLAASAKVKSTFARYSKVRSMTGMTGAEAAQRLLNSQGIYDVTVRRVPGSLSDHYDPRTKTVNLSDESTAPPQWQLSESQPMSAVMPFSMQSATLKLGSALVPIANFRLTDFLAADFDWNPYRRLWFPIVQLGIILFSLAVLFQLVTLPVEFNASSRAVRLLDSTGILSGNEVDGTRRVLGAAALTYVAAAAGSILQLLRLIILFGGRRNND